MLPAKPTCSSRKRITALSEEIANLHTLLRGLEKERAHEWKKHTRHAISSAYPVCWCGSTHSWALAEHGYCPCKKKHCSKIHREE